MPPAEATIDDAVNAAQTPPAPTTGGESIFDSIGSSLEDLVGSVKAIPSVVKDATYYTYYTAKLGLGLTAGFLMGGAPALILPAGIMLGAAGNKALNKEEITFKDMANEGAVGGLLGGLMNYLFMGVGYAGKIVKAAHGSLASLGARGALAVASMPVFLASHEYLNRALISDYKPQPLSDMPKKLKKMWPIIPLILANFTAVPDYLAPALDAKPQYVQMSVAAGISTAYGLLKGEKKKEEKPEAAPTPKLQLPQQYALPKAA